MLHNVWKCCGIVRLIGFTFYNGPSQLDGQSIIGIATLKSKNRKTGPMIQTWIMRTDQEPHTAIKTGADSSVCGDCPLKPSETGVCYVLTFQGPLAIHRAFNAGSYPDYSQDLSQAAPALSHRNLRMGSYGDPVAIPIHVWTELLSMTQNHTGYTHQWRLPIAAPFKGILQASVDTLADVRDAKSAGWRVFRILPNDGTPIPDHYTLCPAEKYPETATCNNCHMCDGSRADIAIHTHGARGNNITQLIGAPV